METKELRAFYNDDLQAHNESYENRRWFKSAQAKAGYVNTKASLERCVWPLIDNSHCILELGPGPGTWTKQLLERAPKATYDLVDISDEMLAQAEAALGTQPNIRYIQSDILDFVPEREYDFFFSSRIIEYVPDYEAAIKIIVSALRSGAKGYIVTKTPQYKRTLGQHTPGAIHNHQIMPKALTAALEASGCRVIKIRHVTCVFPRLKSGVLDRLLTGVCQWLPFSVGQPVSESYAIVFEKA